MQATVAGHHPCPVQWEPSLILLPRDLRCKAGAAISMRDGSSPEAYLCDQVRRSWPVSIKGVRESRRRYRENPREMRGGRKPGVSPVAIGAIAARMILLMAVVPAGTWRGAGRRRPGPAPPSAHAGVPPDPFGPADLDWLRRLARAIGRHQRSPES